MLKIIPFGNPVHLPSKAHPGDAGWDLYSKEEVTIEPGKRHQFKLGYGIEGQHGLVYIVAGKSGYAVNNGIDTIGNIIDNQYRGEISAVLVNHGDEPFEVKPGMKIAQLLVQKVIEDDILEIGKQTLPGIGGLAKSLTPNPRGANGFGSSGMY